MFFSKNKKTTILNANQHDANRDSIDPQVVKYLDDKKKLQSLISNRVVTGVDQLEDTMDQMLYIIKKIAEESEKQFNFLEKSVEVVNETAAFSQQVAVSTNEAGEVSSNALNISQHGKDTVDNTIKNMYYIQGSVENIQKTVLELNDKSKKIEVIIAAIKDIADQTNLLALNAAIEAARAGEHGRGFAVVAQEVRKLAEKSSSSTDEIEYIIREIQQSTSDSIKAMEESVQQVQYGVATVKETEKAIEEIVSAVDVSNKVTTEINQASHKQAQNIESLIQTIDSMENAAQKVLNLTETASMDTEYQKSSVKYLKELSTTLSEITKTTVGVINSISHKVTTEKSIIKVLNSGVPNVLDPAITYEHASINLIANTHIGLVKFGKGTEIIPAVAQSWQLEDDGVTWSFLLRRGVKFHSGKEVKSRDFKSSIERILDPKKKSPNTWLFEMIDGAKEFMEGKASEVKGIIIKDDYRLSITLTKPYLAFILNLAQVAASIVDGEDYSIGAGPYKIKSSHDNGCTLEAFENYYEGRAFIDEVEVIYSKDDSANSFEVDEVHLMTLNKDSYNTLSNNPNYKANIKVENGYGTYYVGFNLESKNPLVQSKLARQALNLSIDKDLLVKNVTNGFGIKAKGPIPPTILQDNNLQGYPYNLSKAKALLSEAGLTVSQNKNLKLYYFNNLGEDSYSDIAIEVKQQLETIGVTVEIVSKELNRSDMLASFKGCDLFILRWIGDTGDPDNFLQPMFNINNVTDFTRYHNPKVEEMLNTAVHTKNPDRRHEAYCNIQSQIVEDAPWIPLYHTSNSYIFNSFIKGVKIHPIGFFRFNNIWLDT
ncbi:MAG: hypothetical protein JJT76_11915 [Clostridiaceae bacterium]|nr:hypothetical protein [Clostridiaceae bacterium]